MAGGVPLIALALALALGASAAAHQAREERLLRDGTWNQRIHAATALGARGPEALPLLAFAARDADWQVRMTAAHEMGRVGRPALGALETVLREEPCRHVRLTAMHWLGSLGPEAADALRRALTDESAMVRLMGRYWLRKDGAAAAEGESSPAAANEDLKACVSSPQPGRAPWAAEAGAPDAAEPPPLEETIITKAPDAPAAAAAVPAPAASPDVSLKLGRARLKELDDLLAPRAQAPERMPAAPSGFGERAAPETSGASIVADAGTGKMAGDPVPALLAYLRSADAAVRARAADELGRRGTPEGAKALTAALKDPVPRVRASAALALGNIGAAADASVPALVSALKKGPEEVTWSAALALGRIGTPRARRAFARHSRESAGELARPAPPAKP